MVEYDFSTMPDRRGHVLSMHALIGAYSPEGRAWMEQLKQVLETNIELAINFFQNEVQGVSLRKPEGTYVVVPDFENWCKSHDRTLDELLRSGVEVGVLWRDGRQFHIPYGTVWHWGCRQRSWKRRCGGSRTMFCKRSGTDGI